MRMKNKDNTLRAIEFALALALAFGLGVIFTLAAVS